MTFETSLEQNIDQVLVERLQNFSREDYKDIAEYVLLEKESVEATAKAILLAKEMAVLRREADEMIQRMRNQTIEEQRTNLTRQQEIVGKLMDLQSEVQDLQIKQRDVYHQQLEMFRQGVENEQIRIQDFESRLKKLRADIYPPKDPSRN